MSDLPLRVAFGPGRGNVEQPGQANVPLGLDRELEATFDIQLADYSAMAPGMLRPYELVRGNVAATVVVFGAIQISCDAGFYMVFLRNNSGDVVTYTSSLVGAAPALTLVGVPARNLQLLAFPRLAINQGTLVAGLSGGFYTQSGAATELGMWVPPTHVLTVSNVTANSNLDVNFLLTGVTVT